MHEYTHEESAMRYETHGRTFSKLPNPSKKKKKGKGKSQCHRFSIALVAATNEKRCLPRKQIGEKIKHLDAHQKEIPPEAFN